MQVLSVTMAGGLSAETMVEIEDVVLESAEAAARVAYLNGADAVRSALDEALNSGDGSYRP